MARSLGCAPFRIDLIRSAWWVARAVFAPPPATTISINFLTKKEHMMNNLYQAIFAARIALGGIAISWKGRHMKALHTLAAVAALVATTLVAPLASAHAILKGSTPQAGAVLAAAPKDITLTFNEKVEEAFSSITLTRGDGGAVATGKAKPDSANPAVMHLATPPLTAGEYTVKWAVAGHDGHRRTGEFKFTVK